MGKFNDNELNLNDMDNVSGGKGKYVVNKIGEKYVVMKAYDTEDEAQECVTRMTEHRKCCHKQDNYIPPDEKKTEPPLTMLPPPKPFN